MEETLRQVIQPICPKMGRTCSITVVDNGTPGPGMVRAVSTKRGLTGLATNCTKSTNSTNH